ncbi:MAG: nickel/cobalt transporter, partial [Pseudomonadota bacterium]
PPADAWAAAPWDHAAAWVFEQQRDFHRQLADALRHLASGDAAGWVLAGVSLAYGVFHAAGPGHGKAVIATYLLTQESHLGRAVRLAVASSFVQGAVAVALVYGLLFLADALPRDARTAVAWSERLSFALLALLGVTLAARAVLRLAASFRPPAITPIGMHGGGCGCDASLAPNQRQLARAADWRGHLAVILSIGLRPCSGAVLVLVLAKAMGLAWAGLWAVAAMSAGTAVTVAGLAVLTVGARKWTASLLGRRMAAMELGAHLVALTGGGVIAALALSLLAGSFEPAHPLGL